MKALALLNNKIFSTMDSRSLGVFRLIFCSFLTYELIIDKESMLQAHLTHTYNAIPLFLDLGITHFSPIIITSLFYILVISLSSAAIGLCTRAALWTSFITIIFYLGQYLSLFKSPHSPYVYHSKNIVVFIIFILACSPHIGRWRIDKLLKEFFQNRESELRDMTSWPYFLILATISFLYFGSGYCKILTSGLGWASGSNIQASLIRKFLVIGHEPAWNLAQQYWICSLLGKLTLFLEITFPIILLLSKRVVFIYCISALLMHVSIKFFMDISFLRYHCLCFLILIDWDLIKKTMRLSKFF